MNIAIYDLETGLIKRFVGCPITMIADQLEDGEEFYLNCPTQSTHIINNEAVMIDSQQLLSLSELKVQKAQEITEARFMAEHAGIIIDNKLFRTDREAQSQLSSALTTLREGFTNIINFKTDGTWITLGLSEITNITEKVFKYIQSCFNKEKELNIKIGNAKTKEELALVVWIL